MIHFETPGLVTFDAAVAVALKNLEPNSTPSALISCRRMRSPRHAHAVPR